MESWYRDELCELAQQTIQKSTSNESAVIHFRDKFGVVRVLRKVSLFKR